MLAAANNAKQKATNVSGEGKKGKPVRSLLIRMPCNAPSKGRSTERKRKRENPSPSRKGEKKSGLLARSHRNPALGDQSFPDDIEKREGMRKERRGKAKKGLRRPRSWKGGEDFTAEKKKQQCTLFCPSFHTEEKGGRSSLH